MFTHSLVVRTRTRVISFFKGTGACLSCDNNVCFYYISSRVEANLEMNGKFIIRDIYDDAATYNVVGAASKVLGKPM